MAGYGVITFTTDYGLADGFVGVCHGVIAGIAPAARVIDVTHQVTRGDVRQGALVLAQTLPYFPAAVHVAVVDPGVGTTRRAIAVATASAVLIGPDNGLLAWAADALGGARAAVELTNDELFVRPVRHTFHGRDIFAPVAAHIAAGRPLTDAGPSIEVASLVRLPAPRLTTAAGVLTAEVLAVDQFGNVQLAAGAAELTTLGATGDPVRVAGSPAKLGQTFGSVAEGELVVYLDSSDQVAVAVNRGDAARRLGLGPGDLAQVTTAAT